VSASHLAQELYEMGLKPYTMLGCALKFLIELQEPLQKRVAAEAAMVGDIDTNMPIAIQASQGCTPRMAFNGTTPPSLRVSFNDVGCFAVCVVSVPLLQRRTAHHLPVYVFVTLGYSSPPLTRIDIEWPCLTGWVAVALSPTALASASWDWRRSGSLELPCKDGSIFGCCMKRNSRDTDSISCWFGMV
jgi:hypothetical protein